jgi:hypothetical protein
LSRSAIVLLVVAEIGSIGCPGAAIGGFAASTIGAIGGFAAATIGAIGGFAVATIGVIGVIFSEVT